MKYSIPTQNIPIETGSINAAKAVPLNKVIYPNSKICRLARLIDWQYLEDELGFLFRAQNSPSLRLVLGLLYLQSIENLSSSEVIAKWKTTPEWQYFCGQELLSDDIPLPEASLSIWSRAVGSHGRGVMVSALVTGRQIKRLH